MIWLSMWIGACNFIAFSLLIVTLYLMVGLLMDDNR